jgi:hypothetical protein
LGEQPSPQANVGSCFLSGKKNPETFPRQARRPVPRGDGNLGIFFVEEVMHFACLGKLLTPASYYNMSVYIVNKNNYDNNKNLCL